MAANDKAIKLECLGTFYKGTGIPRDSVNSGELPAVRYGELYTDYDAFVDGKTRSKISEEVAKGAFKLEYGDILLAGSGETPEDIGKSAAFLLQEGYAGGDTIIFRPDKSKVNPKFLAYYFETEVWKKQRRRVAQGKSVVHIHVPDLKKMTIALPDLETQEKIVQILDTSNKNVEYIKNLIKLKNNLFLGLMRSVLAALGSKEYQLGKIAVIKKGEQLNKDTLSGSGVPVINGGIEPSGFTEEGNIESDTITISEGGNSCGYVNYQKEPFWLGGHCYAINPNEINKKLLYYILKNNERKIKRLRVGSGLPNIQKEDLRKFKISIPPLDRHERITSSLNLIEEEINYLCVLIKKEEDAYKYLLNHLIAGDFDLSNIKLEKGKE